MEVEIDEEALLREFDARLAALGPEPAEGQFLPAGEDGWGETLKEWQAAESIHQGFVPAWQISTRTKDGWQKAAADCGDRYAAGGADKINNAGPVVRLLYYTAVALVGNFDFKTMRFKPAHERENPKDPVPEEGDKTQESPDADAKS